MNATARRVIERQLKIERQRLAHTEANLERMRNRDIPEMERYVEADRERVRELEEALAE